MHSLVRLFEYPWFSRAWVVQEMYHAVEVTVLCEPHHFDWVSFEWFIEKWLQAADRMGVYSTRSPMYWKSATPPAKPRGSALC
jgi:hypothetical protein